MIFSIILILMLGVIAFFHYVQGFFSATLSAIIAIIAATIAVSYQETVVNTLLKGKMADQANAMMMCAIFAATYLILRIIFDKAVPGNVSVPLIADKIGAGVMGIVAGIFATGIVALAAQMLPFGPSIGMFSRYPVKDAQSVMIPTQSQSKDSTVYDEMADDRFEPAKENGLWVPVDNIVLATVEHLSNGGALAGERTLSSIHPNYTQELFGQRIGIQVGAKHSALNTATDTAVTAPNVFIVSSLPTADPEYKALRQNRKIPTVTTPKAGQVLVVVRIMVGHTAADDADGVFRFSTGAIRLVANSKDYFPVGVVENGSTLMSQKMDDYLFLDLTKSDQGVDAAFLVDKTDIFDPPTKTDKVAPGCFVEMKRYAKVDLSGVNVQTSLTSSPAVEVLRKPLAIKDVTVAAPAPAASATPTASSDHTPRPTPVTPATPTPETPATPAAPTEQAVLDLQTIKASSTLPVPIGVEGVDQDAQHLAVAGGFVSLKDGKFISVQIDPTETLEKLATAANKLDELYVPAGKKVIQVTATKGVDFAAIASRLSSAKLKDSDGATYSPNGVFSTVQVGAASGLFMRFDLQQSLETITAPSGTAGDVVFIFIVPATSNFK